MRIVIVCDPSRVDGGAAKVAIASARGLANAGASVGYICTSGPPDAALDHPNIRVYCLNMTSVWDRKNPVSAAAQGIWNNAALRQVEKILSGLPRENTLVHFHQWTKSFSPSVLEAPARLGLPSVISLHDYFLACPNGAYYNFPQAAPCTVTPLSGGCLTARCDSRSNLHKAVRVTRQYATQKALSRAGASLSLLSVSAFAEHIMDAFLPKQHPRFVVRSPIEIEQQEPVRVTDNRQFVFVGRMTEEKGVRQLAAAARQTGLPVTFVGDGPLLENLKAQGDPIRCTGWLDPAGVDRVLRQARALVFPSTWYETGGLVVLEALARGIPVLVSRKTAAAEFVEHGVNGFLIAPHDIAALQDRMRDLMDDATAENMGRQAFDRYWANPQTETVHVENLLRVYQAILSQHRAGLPASAA
ncbi:MAG TPA: glycosyltransferase [Rhizomicrobium sp.]|nr:glycosyltransferase [Rhizomicrobium sp.]